MDKLMDLDVESFTQEVLNSETPVLVDFWSQTCPHCLRLGPDFDKAAAQHKGKVKFAKVSVQEARALFSQYDVHAVPTLIIFRGGEELARREGAASPEEITSWLNVHT